MKALMYVDESKYVRQERGKWKAVVSAVVPYVYVCMFNSGSFSSTPKSCWGIFLTI